MCWWIISAPWTAFTGMNSKMFLYVQKKSHTVGNAWHDQTKIIWYINKYINKYSLGIYCIYKWMDGLLQQPSLVCKFKFICVPFKTWFDLVIISHKKQTVLTWQCRYLLCLAPTHPFILISPSSLCRCGDCLGRIRHCFPDTQASHPKPLIGRHNPSIQ